MPRDTKGSAAVLARNVRALRRMKGLTQNELALLARVSRPTVANIEGRKYLSTRTSVVESLASALGVSSGELLTEGAQ